MTTSHLDLGCGQRPKNPYHHELVFGVDIRKDLQVNGVQRIEAANLSSQPIPFDDNQFDSVSAYDFLEHVPRVWIDAAGHTHFPFIKLMDEIWRVLKPGGLLYAVTPAYPHEKAFRDPTHVNIITSKTYRYFARPWLDARMYGYKGAFDVKRHIRLKPRTAYESTDLAQFALRQIDGLVGRRSHMMWEFSAYKP